MQTHLQKILVVLPLAGLLVLTLSACDAHHRRSYHSSAVYGGYSGQAPPYGEPYDEHRDERDRDHQGNYYGHGY